MMFIETKGNKFNIIQEIFNVRAISDHTEHTWELLFYLYRLARNKDIILTNELLFKELRYGKTILGRRMDRLVKVGLITKTKINRVGNSIIFTTRYDFTPFGLEVASNIYNIIKCVYKNQNQVNELKEDEKIVNEVKGEVTNEYDIDIAR